MTHPQYTIPAEQHAYEEAYSMGYAGRDWSADPDWPCASAKGYWTGRGDAQREYEAIHTAGERILALMCVAAVSLVCWIIVAVLL